MLHCRNIALSFLGLAQIILAAGLPSLNDTTRSSSHTNVTTGVNLNLPSSVVKPNYPIPDPYDYDNEGTLQVLEFYDYRGPLPHNDVIQVTYLASTVAHRRPAKALIDTGHLTFRSGDVLLQVYPEEEMTWRMCANAVWGMRRFVQDVDMFFGWSFFIVDRGRVVGKGWLTDKFADAGTSLS